MYIYRRLFFYVTLYVLSFQLLSETTISLKKESSLTTDDSSPHEKENRGSKESLLFVGDIMLGRHVEVLSNLNSLGYPFLKSKSLLFGSTYVIANLEGPISEKHTLTPSLSFGFDFKKEVTKALSDNHITAVSLANNHTSDQGEAGYLSTVSELDKVNIPSFGHSRHFKPNFITQTIDGVSLSTFGINLISPFWDEKDTLDQIKILCQENKENNFIAFIHAGTEYNHKESGYQVEFAHKLIDETCVRVIIGSHPHVVQGIEKYKGKLIFYSLGNFIFDQYFSEDTQEGLTIKITTLDEKLVFTLIPTTQQASIAFLPDESLRKKILSTIADASSDELKDAINYGVISE